MSSDNAYVVSSASIAASLLATSSRWHVWCNSHWQESQSMEETWMEQEQVNMCHIPSIPQTLDPNVGKVLHQQKSWSRMETMKEKCKVHKPPMPIITELVKFANWLGVKRENIAK